MKPALVFATRRPPFPLDNGARIRAHRLATGLADAFEVTLVTYDHAPGSPDGHVAIGAIEAALPGIVVETVPGLAGGKRSQQLVGLLRARSWEWGRYELPRMRAAIEDAARRTDAAIVHLDDPGVALPGPLAGRFSSFAPHNIEYRIVQGSARAESGMRKVFAEVDWRRVKREEERLWRSMPLCVAVSEIDAQAMRAAGAQRVEIAPNGADAVERLPLRRRGVGDPLRLVFVGSGGYLPYERGMAWFGREVLPRLCQRLRVEIDVVGSLPRSKLAAPEVRYAGRVPTVAPYYENADAVIVPVFEGSGTRLKVVEALAYGRPVVSTTLGAEGLPVRPGEHFLRADDPDGFAGALFSLADRSIDVERMVSAGRASVEPLFWPAVAARLRNLYLSLAERRSVPEVR